MRNTVLLMHVSLDGFVAGPRGELEWITLDPDLEGHVKGLLAPVDTALYGRVTYGMMKGFWPTVPNNPESTPHEHEHARWLDGVEKVVVSKTLKEVTWNNARLLREVEKVEHLKRQPGGDIMVFGSAALSHSLMRRGLIDAYRLNVNPIVLGGGIPLFGAGAKQKLELRGTKPFASGVVALHYQRT
jgi:dihydrofolate reductase